MRRRSIGIGIITILAGLPLLVERMSNEHDSYKPIAERRSVEMALEERQQYSRYQPRLVQIAEVFIENNGRKIHGSVRLYDGAESSTEYSVAMRAKIDLEEHLHEWQEFSEISPGEQHRFEIEVDTDQALFDHELAAVDWTI
jgi:hypothetical protein